MSFADGSLIDDFFLYTKFEVEEAMNMMICMVLLDQWDMSVCLRNYNFKLKRQEKSV